MYISARCRACARARNMGVPGLWVAARAWCHRRRRRWHLRQPRDAGPARLQVGGLAYRGGGTPKAARTDGAAATATSGAAGVRGAAAGWRVRADGPAGGVQGQGTRGGRRHGDAANHGRHTGALALVPHQRACRAFAVRFSVLRPTSSSAPGPSPPAGPRPQRALSTFARRCRTQAVTRGSHACRCPCPAGAWRTAAARSSRPTPC